MDGVTVMKKLLFLLSDAGCSMSMPVTATLAWLAKEKGIEFDAYFVGRSVPEVVTNFFPKECDARKLIDGFLTPEDVGLGWMGGIAPFRESHIVDVYSVLNYYDVLACSNVKENRRFMGFLKILGKRLVSVRKKAEVAAFYEDVFSHFKEKLPAKAVMVPSTPFGLEDQLLIESYCYPEIFFSKSLGLDTSIAEEELDKLWELGLREISLLYCPQDMASKLEKLGFSTKIIDSLKPGDTYGTATKRIFDRWKDHAKGVAYSDPNLTLYWAPLFCRKNILSLFDFDWEKFASVVADCSDQTNSKIIWGRQLSDNFIPVLSKRDKIFVIIDAGRPAVTIKQEIPYAPAPVVETPWDNELSDGELLQKAKEGGIPATILLYAGDVRHLTIAPNLFPSASLMRVKVGVAVPVDFYEYIPEWMDDVYIPYEDGGSVPYIEPMICSAGIGVATEAKGYLSGRTLTESLIKTKEQISKQWGEAAVPIGYYPFQDASPFYKRDTAEPQFEAVRSAGFQYCVTYKDEDKFPRIVYEKDGFVAVNQQVNQWTRNPFEDLKKWEEKISKKGESGWIIISIDSPFFGFMFYEMKSGNKLIDAMNLIKKGGASGKLFSATPHEISRFAKIIKQRDF